MDGARINVLVNAADVVLKMAKRDKSGLVRGSIPHRPPFIAVLVFNG